MYCCQCGKEVPDQAKFCPSCGGTIPAVAVHNEPEPSPAPPPRQNPTPVQANPTVFCRSCGKQIHEKATVCPFCGAAAFQAPLPVNVWAIVSFIVSIISFFCSFGILSLIFSLIAIDRSKVLKSGKGLSVAAIVISLCRFAIIVIALILSAILIAAGVEV